MKLMVSKVFAAYLGRELKDYRVVCGNLMPDAYRALVGTDEMFATEQWDLADNGTMRVIKIVYPDDYQALPTYLSTYTINKLFGNIRTEAELKREIKEALTI